ncbi:MAG: hypothetical protein JW900_15755 [Anaerolineae bacterium]|nr:hypothetical protein [Anaerolineae bacterium]
MGATEIPWTPPESYVPVPSAIDGIEIYGPAEQKAEKEQTRTFKCPACGGVTSYDATQQNLVCPHCGHRQDIAAKVVGQTADQFEFTLETMERAQYGWGAERSELACESCGAVVAVAKDALTNTCAFCGSHRVLAREADPNAPRPTALIPFKTDRAQCQAGVNEWLGRGWMHPPELRNIRALQEMTGVYLPYWTFDANLGADWKAEVGTERTESYYQDGEWKERTVIDWDWRSGSIRRAVSNHLVAGTARVSHVLLERITPFTLQELVEYEPGYLAGWQAKTYDLPLDQAWEIGKENMREMAKQDCYRDTGSSHVRNMQMTVDFADEAWRYILLPIYLASYHFDERTFQVVVNGQTGAVAGQKPVAWLRIWLAIAAILSPGACLGLLGLLLAWTGIGAFGIVLGLVLLVAGLIGAIVIFRNARAAEEI